MGFLIELIKEHKISAIIASHNPMISQIVDKNANIEGGKIVYN
jgi:ABC-type lipoprotein export system ATPase subunit